jgi:DNA segregation ATPase FtsK/SpoIIIE and related proteins
MSMLLGTVVNSAVSGVIGNRADSITLGTMNKIIDNFNKNKRLINHDLQKAVLRSYYLGLKSICEECLQNQDNGSKTKAWLKDEIEEIQNDLKKIDNNQYNFLPIEDIDQIKLLITTDQGSQADIEALKDKVIDMALDKEIVPKCYTKLVNDTLYQRICGFFAFEIKHNDVVNNIFQSQLLSNMDVKISTLTERLIKNFEQDVPALKNTLNRIEESLTENQKSFEEAKSMLIEIGTSNEEKLDEVLRILKVGNGSDGLPDQLDFLEMFNAKDVEMLKSNERWQKNEPYKSLAAPVGVKAGGELFNLNICGKYEGFPGIIAGVVSSGKTEFLTTYILSMAVNFHPDEVSFIIIDYNSTSSLCPIIGLPHISAAVTDIENNGLKNIILSIKKELARRQNILFKSCARDINHYQSLYREYKNESSDRFNTVSTPMPRLIIIVNEFSVIKKERPGLLDELISIAWTGRKLGVSLIMTTQEISVVSEKIRNDAMFRMCFQVFEKRESHAVLKHVDAAEITQPGRCYYQTREEDDLEFVQVGYSGCRYSLGKGCNEKQLDAVVNYLVSCSESCGVTPLSLWTEELKSRIDLNEIEEFRENRFDGKSWKRQREWIAPIIGMAGDAEMQKQYPFRLDIGERGHVAILGKEKTGKTTLIQTLIYSAACTYSPEEFSFYYLDWTDRNFGTLSELPHCLGLAVSYKVEGAENIINKIKQEIDDRKSRFNECNVDNIKAFNSTFSSKLPAIFLVINHYIDFKESLGHLNDIFSTIVCEGANCGIYLIIASRNIREIGFNVFLKMGQCLTFQMEDKSDYDLIFGRLDGFEPGTLPGRGLIKLDRMIEFQTALAVDELDEYERELEIKEVFKTIKSAFCSIEG